MRSVVSIQPRLLAGCLSTAFHVEPTTACSGAATDVRESECMQGKWPPRACIVWSRLSNSAPERSGSWGSHTQPQQACSPAGCLSAARVIGAIWYCGSRPGKLSDIRKRSRETQRHSIASLQLVDCRCRKPHVPKRDVMLVVKSVQA